MKIFPIFDFTIIDTERRATVGCRIGRNINGSWHICLKQSDQVIDLGQLSNEKMNALLIGLLTGDSDLGRSVAAALKLIFDRYRDIFEF